MAVNYDMWSHCYVVTKEQTNDTLPTQSIPNSFAHQLHDYMQLEDYKQDMQFLLDGYIDGDIDDDISKKIRSITANSDMTLKELIEEAAKNFAEWFYYNTAETMYQWQDDILRKTIEDYAE